MTDLYHDYEIVERELISEVKVPPKILIILFILISIALNFLIAFYLIADLGDVESLVMKLILAGVYYPMTIILENSNIKTFNPESRSIKVPGATLRGRLDALVGIGAISTGWNIFIDTLDGERGTLQSLLNSDGTFLLGLDYFIWLIYVMLLSWPILFPAALFFYLTLEKTVNEFRTIAIDRGVKVGVSKIREPTAIESENIRKVSEMYSKKKQPLYNLVDHSKDANEIDKEYFRLPLSFLNL